MLMIPKVIIAGGGFAGLSAAKRLADEAVAVTLLDRANHHLFQPLLYQVATAVLSPAQIAQPIRHILNRAANITVEMDEIVQVLPGEQVVVTRDGRYAYDYLILATGARHSYFGHPEWEAAAPGLKTLEDAVEIRSRMLMAFEKAERTEDPEERKALLTFVIVGGGPTGVEMAGAMTEVARYSMVRDFRRIKPESAKVILLDGGPRVLQGFDEVLSIKAKEQLERIGVEVHSDAQVTHVGEYGVEVAGREKIACRTVVWAAGNEASPLGKQLGVETDRAGRVIVGPDLTIPGYPSLYVVGDLASFSHQDGKPLGGVAPVAMQMGKYAARSILAKVVGQTLPPFHYIDRGSMATIGRHAAVADVRGVEFSGHTAWLAWLFVHLMFLVGFRNRMSVLFQWSWSYFNYYRGARLITEMKGRFERQNPS